ncbi:restriction endonuclease subunit S [Pseudarthrobacter sp. PH31-O2]|uniref:restriction endonuclease subunit S n=1 Tax=Pseudarthrobacter sp. PH31-O2 TaxID=3046206 RepID=UPI0024B8899B|nr:restriction endonuclease subunit S [Pseudarthrobacter sp. PH31-O2]MDJ0353371.1 restriction endonuclease subunit S [Pseudarthrobacter sp. PH31-O2]
MTALNAYAEYKDSGHEWLGSVPTHWSVVPSKWLFSLRADRPDSDAIHLMASQKYGVISQAQFMAEKDQRVVQTIVGGENMKKICPDDFLIHLRSFQGGIEWSANEGKVSPAYTVLRPKRGVHPPFFYYLLKSAGYIQELRATTNQLRDGQSMNYSQFAMVPLVEVPLQEQVGIAEFLDRETAQIDDLIGKQERLIELLAEKRQAIIIHTVTKGLDPTAPTKPSGIPWLGDVPVHWSLPRLKNCSRVKRGRFMHRPRNAPHLYGGEYPFIQTGAIARAKGKYISDFSQTLSAAGMETSAMMPKGTLVMAIAANIADVAILSFDSCAPDSVVGFQPTSQANTDFLYYALTAKRDELTSEAPVTSQGNLNVERVGSVTVPLPPIDEQSEIVDSLDNRLAQMSHIVTKALATMRLLLERRSALISAAVTGKIDVRDEAFAE